MLVSDKYKFIIAMPTKTGTNSMRAIVEKWERRSGSPRVLSLLTGYKATRHRIAPPPGKEDYARYILTREERSRYISMYEYLRRKDWEWSASVIRAIEDRQGREAAWMRMLQIIATVRQTEGYFDAGRRGAHGKRPYMWTDTQYEMLDYMRGIDIDGSQMPWVGHEVGAMPLEDLAFAWRSLLDRHDVEEDELFEVDVAHRNASPVDGRLFADAGEYWAVPGAESLYAQVIAPG